MAMNTTTKRRTKCAICYEYRIDNDEHRASERHQAALRRMQDIINESKSKA